MHVFCHRIACFAILIYSRLQFCVRATAPVALLPCVESEFSSKGDAQWKVGAVYVAPSAELGKPYEFRIEGSSSSLKANFKALSTSHIFMRFKLKLALSHGSHELPIQVNTTLCTALGYQPPCPRLSEFSSGNETFSAGTPASPIFLSVPGLVEGLWDVELESGLLPPFHAKPSCVRFEEPVLASSRLKFSAIVAFTIASAASWTLGKWFPIISFPLITGYLVVGAIVGPYGTDLVRSLHIWYLGPFINNGALAFIAFAAGNELFFPELRDLLRTIIQLMTSISVVTVSVMTLGFIALGPIAAFAYEQGQSCHIGIGLLVACVGIARSPSSAVAICKELDARGNSAKLMMGVTIMSDIVVLVGFALISPITSSLCPAPSAEGASGPSLGVQLLLTLLSFSSDALLGMLVGAMLVGILLIPFRKIKVGSHSVVIHRSIMKGMLIMPLGWFVFLALPRLEELLLQAFGLKLTIEPLMVNLIGASIAGHAMENRKKFTNILEKAAPYVFLPFFTLTGASLQLNKLVPMLPLALLVTAMRFFAIFVAGFVGGKTCMRKSMTSHQANWLWLTLMPQAGLAMSLALQVKALFPHWGSDFQAMILSVIVLNQILGPPLSKVGLLRLMEQEDNSQETPMLATSSYAHAQSFGAKSLKSQRGLTRFLTVKFDEDGSESPRAGTAWDGLASPTAADE
eukprot:TRINITY_DN22306_c0_g1_i1.p1 TRINITY_DN22306_c0_g1~~TRINITY_DN22306_c0_g1_i1.p1  ORF type:complete len:687 (-),score=104.14 TRINITY_DN22306_c0_g1_i1:98-2158(-)